MATKTRSPDSEGKHRASKKDEYINYSPPKFRDELMRHKHIAFFKRVLQVLPSQQLDTHRVSVAFFAISGLDILESLQEIEIIKNNIINWIYSLQVQPKDEEDNWCQCGFRGCPMLGHAFDINQASKQLIPSDSSNIAMTYTALVTLLILGDSLSRVHKKAVIAGIHSLQQADGSFVSVLEGSENDMRFVYCACCVCFILDDWSGMDVEKTISYIVQSLSYEGAFGQRPFNEAHGGSTFCAVASLVLLDRLHTALTETQLNHLKRWLLRRQESGFTGRPNKPPDTCYSFWVGATLQMLGILDLSNVTFNRSFVLSTQSPITGGFSKYPDHIPGGKCVSQKPYQHRCADHEEVECEVRAWLRQQPKDFYGADPLHTYLGLGGLSLIGEPGLGPIFPALNMSQRAYDHLANLHQQWKEGPNH